MSEFPIDTPAVLPTASDQILHNNDDAVILPTDTANTSTTPTLSLPSFLFIVPTRKIFEERDLEEFKKSSARTEITNFIKVCSKAVYGKRIADVTEIPTPVLKFTLFMDKLYGLVDEIPPLQQPMRYGNRAFRNWHARMMVETQSFLVDLLSTWDHARPAVIELAPYLHGAFGDATRIDYGTGHELNIAIFFLLLFKLRLLAESDLAAVVLSGFRAYIRVMRRLQEEYRLEPAGSHGVWGLDDYHCLTFLWGSSQLCDHEYIFPSSIHNTDILREEAGDYLYLEGIAFIRKIKSSASFGETSPMLNDISSLGDWKRVMGGLVRLFEGEVLFKLPVVQHLLFGSILKANWTPSNVEPTHFHQASGLTPGVFAADRGNVEARAPWARASPTVGGTGQPIGRVVGIEARAPWAGRPMTTMTTDSEARWAVHLPSSHTPTSSVQNNSAASGNNAPTSSSLPQPPQPDEGNSRDQL